MFPWPSLNARKKTCYNERLDHRKQWWLGLNLTYQQPTVYVGKYVLFTPFEGVRVEWFTVVCSSNIVLTVCLPKCINCRDRPPVLPLHQLLFDALGGEASYQGRYHTVATTWWIIISIITSTLSQINLPTSRPRSIYRIFRHHPCVVKFRTSDNKGTNPPNRWPNPISFRHFCNNLYPPISDSFLALSCYSRTSNWINDSARGLIAVYWARVYIGRSADSFGGQI